MSRLFGEGNSFGSARVKLRRSRHLGNLIDRLSMIRLSSSDSVPGEKDEDDGSSAKGSPVMGEKGSPLAHDGRDSVSSESLVPDLLTIRCGPPSGQARKTRLLDLPQELFDEITSYLGPAHIVVLALVNKELFYRFLHLHPEAAPNPPNPAPNLPAAPNPHPAPGTDANAEAAPTSWKVLGEFIKMADTTKSKARGTLLSLLDLDLLDLVYCYKCKKMHDPFVTFIDRAYAPTKSIRCTDYAMDHHMPPRATRKLLRAITKRRKRGAPYTELMSQVNNTVTTYQSGTLVQISLRMRYRGDLLLLRRQHVVSSIDKSSLALWLFRQQLKCPGLGSAAATTMPKVHRICHHFTWGEKYSKLLEDLLRPLCTGTHSDDGEQASISHTPACFKRDPYDASKDASHPIARRFKEPAKDHKAHGPDTMAALGDVLSCDKCTTDFSMDVVELPAPFHWGFVLTSWLDLGHIDFCTKWDSHREPRMGRVCARDAAKYGRICQKFENLPDKTHFVPRVGELNRQRMLNYGWGERAAQGRDRGVTWSSGHACDPVTGRLLDPDPLEPEDE